MLPETRVSQATTALLALACVATAEATLQAKFGVRSTFANPLTPELPNSLPINRHLLMLGSVLVDLKKNLA
jgi:hypothetical protein